MCIRDRYIDYDEVEKLAEEFKPKMIIAGASAYSREIDFKKFRKIADKVGALLFADIAHIAGLVVGGVHQSPFPHCDIVTTTTHKTLRGPRGAMIMCKAEYAKVIDKAVFPGLQGGPHNHTTAAIAVALGEAALPSFKTYAEQIVKNAQAMTERFIELGYDIVSGGTDNHLFLLNVTNVSDYLGGEQASQWLEDANISVNKNTIPNDKRSPRDPSGIRIGTAAITTRGLTEKECVDVVNFIDRALRSGGDATILKDLRCEVGKYMSKFVIPGIND